MTFCVECVMTWLRFGDGAICLACRAPVVWKGKEKWLACEQIDGYSEAEIFAHALATVGGMVAT